MEGMDSDVKSEGGRATKSASREDLESQSDEIFELGPARSQNGHGCADISDKEENGDPFEVSFDGDDDPLCPRSMNTTRKWLLVCIVGLGSLCVTCTSSIYTATYSQMNPEFHQSEIVATLGLSTFVLGIALGPLFLGPLSEFYGRRPIYLISWTMFVVWVIPSAVAHNSATIITTRFINGFVGSAFLSVAGGTVSDVFRRDQIQSPMTIISLSPFIGPSLGPLVGGFINYYTNWRWTYYVIIIWAFALLVLIFLFAPETYHPIKLREKARRMREETGDERWKAPMEKSTKSIPRTIALSLMRPFQLLIFESMCLLLSLLSAVLLGVIYLFFGAFPLVFGNTYGFNLWQVGLSFLGIFIGMLLGAASNPVWHSVHRRLVKKNHGVSEPEFRLASSILGAVMVPIGLFWFAWTSLSHWILPIIGSGIFGCGTLLVFNGVFTFLVDTYPLYAASALAANSFLRCSFAAAFPLFGRQLYQAAGYQWASSVLAFITLALMPLPYIFFHFGKRLRQRSRFTATRA
ncbi:major facilitator superfamily domain-containing protein [Xylaria arbuscula]|nr:major facilitator superfamily domain-containing protein [Xylaria arbuscula]